MSIGVSAGIYTRANNMLGINPYFFSSKWKGSGLDSEELTKLALHVQYNNSDDHKKLSTNGVLFKNTKKDICDDYKHTPDDSLERIMLLSSDKNISKFAENCHGSLVCLKAAVNTFICPPD